MTFYLFFFFQNLNADLQPFVNMSDLPELLLSVCYNANLQRLTVNVIEGKNFKVRKYRLLTFITSFYGQLIRELILKTHPMGDFWVFSLLHFLLPWVTFWLCLIRAGKPMQHWRIFTCTSINQLNFLFGVRNRFIWHF